MRRLPRLGTVSMLVVALMALATPARADQRGDLAFPRIEAGELMGWHVLDRKLWVDGCDGCPGAVAIDLAEDPSLSPQHEDEYLDHLTNGLAHLHDAAQTTAPDRKQALRTAAMQSFAKAAWRLGTSQVSLRQVGNADFARNIFDPTPEPWETHPQPNPWVEDHPQPDPWLTAAGIDLSDGLTLMQHALPPSYDGSDSFPSPPPWIEPIIVQAASEFDEAYTELIEQKPIGR